MVKCHRTLLEGHGKRPGRQEPCEGMDDVGGDEDGEGQRRRGVVGMTEHE